MIRLELPNGTYKELSTVGFRPEMKSRGLNTPWPLTSRPGCDILFMKPEGDND